jgi:hypothetical protein
MANEASFTKDAPCSLASEEQTRVSLSVTTINPNRWHTFLSGREESLFETMLMALENNPVVSREGYGLATLIILHELRVYLLPVHLGNNSC